MINRPVSSRLMGVLAIGLLLGVLAACNTVEGVGKDVGSAGKAIENTAEDAKN